MNSLISKTYLHYVAIKWRILGCSQSENDQNVLALERKHQIGDITTGETGTGNTGVCCTCAPSNYMPPVLYLKERRWRANSRGALPCTHFASSENSWTMSETFVKCLKHVVSSANPAAETPVLILDGHVTPTETKIPWTFQYITVLQCSLFQHPLHIHSIPKVCHSTSLFLLASVRLHAFK
jgi:hypothetical protein